MRTDILTKATEVLRDKGYVVVGSGTGTRYVFKQVDASGGDDTDYVFWNNLHLVYVAVGDTLVNAHRVPAFKAERTARGQRIKAADAARRLAEDTAQKADERFFEALKADGLKADLRYGTISVKVIDLAAWLWEKHGVAL